MESNLSARENCPSKLCRLTSPVVLTAVVLSLICTGSASANSAGLSLSTAYFAMSPAVRTTLAYQSVFMNPKLHTLFSKDGLTVSATQQVKDGEFETTKFQHFYKGIEVMGSMALHHFDQGVQSVTDRMARFDLKTRPSLSAEQAVQIALGNEETQGDLNLAEKPVLKILPNHSELSAKLVYKVALSGASLQDGRDLYVDAHSGKLLMKAPHAQELLEHARLERTAELSKATQKPQIQVYSAAYQPEDAYDETGAPKRIDGRYLRQHVKNGVEQRGADDSARRAAKNAQFTVDYYMDHHRRNSFDDQGGEVISLTHVGHRFSNAFWYGPGKFMAYGDGDGRVLGDFTQAVDVAGHEMTHAVVSETANLVYVWEMGALNEAFADIFAKLLDGSDDWELGRDIFIDRSKPDHAIRNIRNPNALNSAYLDERGRVVFAPYPKHINEAFPVYIPAGNDWTIGDVCDDENDYCWVHVNSTIPSHAAYLVAQAIGKEKMGKLYYRTLTHYLTELSDFNDHKEKTLEACGDLYSSRDCQKVEEAFEAVGL